MCDKKDNLLARIFAWVPRTLANFLHEERLILRMQVEFRFIDNQIRLVSVVQVRKEHQKFFDSVAFIAVKSINISGFSKYCPRDEMSRVPFQKDLADRKSLV